MTPETLKAAMAELEFNSADLALLMGVTRRAVQLWLSGVNPIPQSAALVIHALQQNFVTTDWIADQVAQMMEHAC